MLFRRYRFRTAYLYLHWKLGQGYFLNLELLVIQVLYKRIRARTYPILPFILQIKNVVQRNGSEMYPLLWHYLHITIWIRKDDYVYKNYDLYIFSILNGYPFYSISNFQPMHLISWILKFSCNSSFIIGFDMLLILCWFNNVYLTANTCIHMLLFFFLLFAQKHDHFVTA